MIRYQDDLLSSCLSTYLRARISVILFIDFFFLIEAVDLVTAQMFLIRVCFVYHVHTILQVE